jgi:hypothetical protein
MEMYCKRTVFNSDITQWDNPLSDKDFVVFTKSKKYKIVTGTKHIHDDIFWEKDDTYLHDDFNRITYIGKKIKKKFFLTIGEMRKSKINKILK